MPIIDIDTFTAVAEYSGTARRGTWTPVANSLTGTLTGTPSASAPQIEGHVSGYPIVDGIPDDAIIDSIVGIISADCDSTEVAVAATTTLGSGANGTITITQASELVYGWASQVQVVLGSGSNLPMRVTYGTEGTNLLKVYLGTNNAGAADPLKNTAALVAAEIAAQGTPNITSAVASGTGATAIPVTAAHGYSNGNGYYAFAGNFVAPWVLAKLPIVSGGVRSAVPGGYTEEEGLTPPNIIPGAQPFRPYRSYSVPDAFWTVRKIDSEAIPYVEIGRATAFSSYTKAALRASKCGFWFDIYSAAGATGTIDVTRFTLRVTYHSFSTSLVVNPGQAATVRGPLPSRSTLTATVTGDVSGTVTYLWEFWDGPDTPTVLTPDAAETEVEFTSSTPGKYTFQVTATCTHLNGTVFVSTAQVVLTINPTVPPLVDSFNSFVIGVY